MQVLDWRGRGQKDALKISHICSYQASADFATSVSFGPNCAFGREILVKCRS